MTPPVPLSLNEAAALIGCDPASLRAAAAAGDLDSLPGLRFHRRELHRWSRWGGDRSPEVDREKRRDDPPADTPAAAVRRSLAESRAEGVSFEKAWTLAMATLPIRRPGRRPDRQLRSEAEQWRVAIVKSRSAFERAYTGAAPTPSDHAVVALADAFP